MPTFDPAGYCLPELRVEEFGTHMVFVNMSPEGPSLESMAGSIVDEFREAIPGYDDHVLTGCDPFDIYINWKIAIGNFAECYHCPFAHPEFMAWPPASNFIVFQIDPKGPEHTFESLDYYFRNDPPTEKEKEVVKYHSDVVNEQDIAINHAVQRGVKSLGFGQGRFVVDDYDSWRSEHGIHHFERMVWEALNGPG